MVLRNLFDFMFASPVLAISSLVSVACVSMLVVTVSSNMSISNEVVRLSDDDDYRDTSFQRNPSSQEKSSNQFSPDSKKNSLGVDRNSVDNTNDSNFRDQYYVEDYSSLPTRSDSPSFNKVPSFFNDSNSENVGSVNTTSTSTTNITTTESDDTFDTYTTESDFPATLENTVKIDLDETQTISCRAIVANGPPCMCTLTITDASGSVAEVMDNCRN